MHTAIDKGKKSKTVYTLSECITVVQFGTLDSDFNNMHK